MFEILILNAAIVKSAEFSELVPVVSLMAEPGDDWVWSDEYADAMAEQAAMDDPIETMIRF